MLFPIAPEQLNALGVAPLLTTYLLEIEFATNQAAPLVSYIGEVGSLDYSDSLAILSVSGGAQVPSAAVTASGDPHVTSHDNTVWKAGRCLAIEFILVTGSAGTTYLTSLGLSASTGGSTGASNLYGIRLSNTTGTFDLLDGAVLGGNPGLAIALDTTYILSVVELPGGGFAVFVNKQLIWVGVKAQADGLYTHVLAGATGAKMPTVDFERIKDILTIFDTAYSFATFTLTSFNQSLGAELVSDGNMEAAGVASWPLNTATATVTKNTTSPLAGTQDLKVARASTNNPSVKQTILTGAHIYRWTSLAAGDGTAPPRLLNGATVLWTGAATASGQPADIIFIANLTTMVLQSLTSTGTQFGRFDSQSMKEITLNTVQTGTADGIFDLDLTLPGSPAAGAERIGLIFRYQDASNFLFASIVRSDANDQWNFIAQRYVAGVLATLTSANNVGSVDRLRVVAIGDSLTFFTLSGSTWTKRGTTVTLASLNTQTGISVLYSADITPTRLTSYPYTSSNYNGVDLAP